MIEGNLKKLRPLAAASLIAFTALLSAQNDDIMFRAGEGPDMEITPSGRPRIKDGAWNLTGSIFVWESHADGLAVGYSNLNSTDGNPVQLNDATVQNLKFKWDFGFKVGLGYTFGHDGWGFEALWTHFHNHAHKHVDADDSTVLTPFFTAFNIEDNHPATLTVTSIDAHWKLKMDYVDLDLGREFWVSRWLNLKPFLGLRVGSWKQHYDIDQTGGNVTASLENDEIHMHSDFKAIGPHSGLNTFWSFGCGWGFYGNLGLSLLYGRMDSTYREDLESTTAPFGSTDTADFDDRFRISRLATDLALGLQYERVAGDQQNYYFAVSLGWENHSFLNFNNFYRLQLIPTATEDQAGLYVVQRMYGDLTMQGWTLSARFDF
jgi:hypothetical protein